MAIFNPQLPDVNPPEWGGNARPISDIPADKSKAIAISAAGDLLSGAVKITDQAIKEGIKTDVYAGVDKLREGYTEALQEVRNQQIAATDKSLLPEQPVQNPPMQLQNGLARAKQIGTAIAQSGNKINDTLYTGALNSLAKQLRTQYPGYRDYIDDQIKSVSGVDPANAFMRNLMEDINRASENNKTETNATKSMLRDMNKEGFRDSAGVTAAQVYQLYDAGVFDTNQVNKWVSGAKKVEWDRNQRDIARKTRLDSDADAAVNAGKDLSDESFKVINHNWTTMTLGKGTDTADKLFQFIQQNAGNTRVQDERSQAIGQQLVALRNQTFNHIWEYANRGGSNSIVSKMGGDAEKVRKMIDGNLATFDNAIQSVFNKDWGTAYSNMNFNKAIRSDSTNLLYNAPDATVRKYNRMVGAANEISPQAASEFFKNSLIGDVPVAQKEWLKNLQLEMITQPDKPQGSLTSFKRAVERAKQDGATAPKTVDKLIDTVKVISDPKWGVEHRINTAESFFNPVQNEGVLDDKNFKKDYYDPAQKRQIPGKYSVFTRLSSPETAAGIAELSKAKPELTTMYRTTMSREFGEQLFARELRDAAEFNTSFVPGRQGSYKFSFVDDGKRPPRFEILGRDNQPITDAEAKSQGAPIEVKNRLNIGITGMWNVYSSTGSESPNNDILQTMMQYGYQAPTRNNNSPSSRTDIVDIPGMLWTAITTSQSDKAKKHMEEMERARSKPGAEVPVSR